MLKSKKSIELNNSFNERAESFLINKSKSSKNVNEHCGKRIKISPAVLAIYNKFKQEYSEQNNNNTIAERAVVPCEAHSQKSKALLYDSLCDRRTQYNEIFRSKSTNNMKVMEDMPAISVADKTMLREFQLANIDIHIEEDSSGSIMKQTTGDSSKTDKQTSVTTLRRHSLADKQTSVTTLIDVKKSADLCAVKEFVGASSFTESLKNWQHKLNAHHLKIQHIIDSQLSDGSAFSGVAQLTNKSKPILGGDEPLKQSNISCYRSRSCVSNVDGGFSKKQVHFSADSNRETASVSGSCSGKRRSNRVSPADKALCAFERNEERRRIALATLREIESNAAKTAKMALDRKRLKQIVDKKMVDCIDGEIKLPTIGAKGSKLNKEPERNTKKGVNMDVEIKNYVANASKAKKELPRKSSRVPKIAEKKISPNASKEDIAKESPSEPKTDKSSDVKILAKMKSKPHVDSDIRAITAAMTETSVETLQDVVPLHKISMTKFGRELKKSEKISESLVKKFKVGKLQNEVKADESSLVMKNALTDSSTDLFERTKKNEKPDKYMCNTEHNEESPMDGKLKLEINENDINKNEIENRKYAGQNQNENLKSSDESSQDETLPGAITTTLRHLRPRERSPLIEGFQRENSNLYVVPEIDEYLAEEESEESRRAKNALNNSYYIEDDTSAETQTISSTGNFVYKKAVEPTESQMKIKAEDEEWQIASKKFAAQIADVFKRDAEQWLEEMKGEISLSKLIATTEEIEATNAIDAAFSDATNEEACKTLSYEETSSMKFRKAKSNTVSSIGTTSTDVQSLPPKTKVIRSKQKKQKHVSPLDRIELLKSPRRTGNQKAIEVNVAALSKILIKCPDSACKRNMKLPQFGWHMAVEHFSTLKMDYLAPNEVGHLNILVANVCWATRRPIKLFMLKNMVVDIGCRFYNKYLPIVAMVRPVHCNEIYNRPIFGEPLTEEYLMIWFTGITLKARPLSIELTLRNGDTTIRKTVGLYSIKKNQCLIDVYVSGNAILVTHELIAKLTRGENLILRGEIVVR